MKTALVSMILLLAPSIASAGAWTRDQGDVYASLSLSTLAGEKMYGFNFEQVELASPYRQLSLNAYAETGVIDRWLTLSFSGELFRRNQLDDQGATSGLGDLRIGVWTGLVEAPFRLSFGLWAGIPSGDAEPSSGLSDAEAQLIARSLPTGDGELDFEPVFAFGYSFERFWTAAELGYQLRSNGFSDALRYSVELGARVDRFYGVLRFYGLESFSGGRGASFAGLGEGVTHTSAGLELGASLIGGLGLYAGADTAFRARSLIAAIPLRFGLFFEH